ncbi:unnamed protein product, partial [Amoebophrya sp. A120]
ATAAGAALVCSGSARARRPREVSKGALANGFAPGRLQAWGASSLGRAVESPPNSGHSPARAARFPCDANQ